MFDGQGLMAAASLRAGFIEPMAATQVANLARGAEWSYAIKLDGYRVLALKDGDDVYLLSRRNKDLTRDFPSGRPTCTSDDGDA